MSSEFRNLIPEGDPFLVEQEVRARELGKFGISQDEALALLLSPARWARCLGEDGAQADEIYAEVAAVTDDYEAAHGPSEYWDTVRTAMANIFVVAGRMDLATSLYTRNQDITLVIQQGMESLGKGLLHGLLGPDAFEEFADVLRAAYQKAGRIEEFNDAIVGMLQVNPIDAANFSDMPLERAKERYDLVPWESLDEIIDNATLWPEGMEHDDRLRVAIDFGARLHGVVSGAKIERKEAEALKAFIAEQQAGRQADAWDLLRFISSISLYDNGGAKFGRIFARSMDDPLISAMVLNALLERGRENDAKDVLADIEDPKLYGKLLAINQWHNRDEMAARIEDITVVTTNTRKKYDPALRLGVAEGLFELYSDANGVGYNPDLAAIMQKRAALLARQIEIRYITSLRKK